MGKYYFHSDTARQILSAMAQNKDCIDVSVDLNKNVMALHIRADKVVLDDNNELKKNELLRISEKENRVFVLEDNVLRILEYRNIRYYKLVPTEHAPTVEIDGIKMHRSKGIAPFTDARQKAKEVVNRGDRVLDTCGGLGYTAIWALRLGAREVVSVECDEFIQKLRSENPWSAELSNKRIKLVSADVSEYIKSLESELFDSIIHDPPRLSLAGELYGEEFYRELYRLLAKGGKLFHYTGTPYLVRRGNTFSVNVAKRLQGVGFKKVLVKAHLMGITAVR